MNLDDKVVRAPIVLRICARCGILGWSFEETERAVRRCKIHAASCGYPVELTLYLPEKSLGLVMPEKLGESTWPSELSTSPTETFPIGKSSPIE